MNGPEIDRVYIDLGDDGQPPWRPKHRIPRPPNIQTNPGVELPFSADVLDIPELTISLATPLRVYPTGVHFPLSWTLRRTDERFAEMQALIHNLTAIFRISLPSDLLPTITVDDGDRIVTSQAERPAFTDEPPNTDAALVFTDTAWKKKSNHEYNYTVGLWLWPLPQPRPLTFRLSWPRLGVTGIPVRLDGAVIVDVVAWALVTL